MAATIRRLRTRKDQLTEEQARIARQYVLDLEREGLSSYQTGPIIAQIDRQTASQNEWSFIMLSPQQNRAVVDWLRHNSKRRTEAMAVWAECFTALRSDTGEICLTRAELAERTGVTRDNASTIMTELEGIGAISRVREGRGVRYFMNPNVGTCLKGRSRDEAQAQAVQLTLV